MCVFAISKGAIDQRTNFEHESWTFILLNTQILILLTFKVNIFIQLFHADNTILELMNKYFFVEISEKYSSSRTYRVSCALDFSLHFPE